ncbi:type I polyketide synthase [Nonomuraea soli]|uniref:Acyl transferase domain-containing protein/D-arabinose 1-dehydrogenase-like Zn-dependent alcohol dehydrogenase/acyl carrier protein n=1 Tax=Nonomuraea soli TaxID=1032476 RepID=A0A7W0HS99_9ACTN|nr:type I polyketide synthase [Nonomuraea soli]MBA2893800.1 acyl transferase domain-containing protein/D-arabinose 1-dehydrogenase-like Zn-dependent alcohol dehydrogenase/acyl carrier protein [Nonomuraea soli]
MANEDKLRDYLKRVTADLQQTRRQLRDIEGRDREPIAIVGMGCRYPGGATSPEQLWELVADGGDGISEFPADRGWREDLYHPDPDNPGTTTARHGGFLYDAAEFDAGFFAISPREAMGTDPQQRLFLETCWETFERAGIDPVSVRGSRTGVYAGVMYHDYFRAEALGSVTSGRVAYALDLEGPAVSVDTACSSSLVALHLAVHALRRGECTMALAGGVTVMATPNTFIEFSQQRGLASDGRCKSFATSANGTGWSEGVGVLLLERLSDARANGHNVLAVIRGSAVNQDGASNGLSAPNGPSQIRVIREALADAGLSPSQVDAVEGHGTGTTLGDPIEAQALLAAYGQDREAERPLWLGSLKSNIGHTQAAAGVGGVIKMVMAMRHGVLPRTLHVDEPTEHVDWSAGAVELLTSSRPWPRAEAPRRAAVSAFGFSGTNAHLIIEETPVEPDEDEPERLPLPLVPWVVSAKDETALAAQAARLHAWALAHEELPVADVGWSLATGRSVLDQRAVIVGADRAELIAGLEALAGGTPTPGTFTGSGTGGQLAFLFAGQGSQRLGMGAALAESFPVFADALEEVCKVLDPLLPHPVREAMFSGPEQVLDETGMTQPALFAFEVALYRLLTSLGVTPDVLVGHSVGEIAAAHVAGVLSLADACGLVATRARLMQALPPGGAMLAIAAPEADILPLLEGRSDIGIAAVNGPDAVVVSGDAAAVDEIAALVTARTRRLRVSHAFHSPLIEPMMQEFRRYAQSLTYHEPSVPIISDVTGRRAQPGQLTDAGYWVDHVRQAVRFGDAVASARSGGATVFVEIGPDAVLTGLARQILDGDEAVTFVPAVRKDRDEARSFVEALGRLHARGVTVGWDAYFADACPRRVDLPTYAFQRKRYWFMPGSFAAQQAAEAADPEFWAAVEREDVDALAATLNIDDGSPLAAVLPALSSWRRRRREQDVLDSWRYRVTWEPVALPEAGPSALGGTWLIAVPHERATDEPVTAVARALERHGATTKIVSPALDGATAATGVLALHCDPAQILQLIQAADGIDAALWVGTDGGQSVSRVDFVRDPVQGAVAGLVRVHGLEHPQRPGGTVDLPETLDTRVLGRLVSVLAAAGHEDQLAVRASGTFARRLTRAPRQSTGTGQRWRAQGTALITGGTGGLGAHVARWLARGGAEHLLLTSRRGTDAPGAAELVAELEELGARVTVARCDVADRAALQSVISQAEAAGDPIRSVFHTAGVPHIQPLLALGADELAEATSAKIVGASLLDELLPGPLDAFVLFSSGAGVWGGSHNGAYAAGNAFLDSLAAHRRARGLPGTAIAWGFWDAAGGGMTTLLGEDDARRSGVAYMDPLMAIEGLWQALDDDETALVVADIDWPRFAPLFTAARRRPLLDGVPEAVAALSDGEATPEVSELGAELRLLDPREQARLLVAKVRQEVAGVLGYADPAEVGVERAFRDLGFDSVTAVELRGRLNQVLGIRLPATVVFDHPNVKALAELARTEILGVRQESAGAGPAHRELTDDPIVIVGMSCRTPGDVNGPDDLWRLVAEGGDAISRLPGNRGWDVEGIYDPDPEAPFASYTQDGGFVLGAGEFDPEFFGISPREALAMDPQQRLLLEASWEAIEHGRIDPGSLRGSRTGVFVGAAYEEYGRHSDQVPLESIGHLVTGTLSSIASGRVAYALGFEGPAVTVDTACSSSLVALHLAVQALRNGDCDLALAGGVTVMCTPLGFIGFSLQGALARDGRCKAFAGAADGFGLSEGVGMLLVERLSDARRNGHPILAVVRGSAINQDGASNGLTAPNGPSQQRVIRQALANAGLTPADVDAVEAHGTGTTLGDPIEAQALIATYGQDRELPLWLGSIKSNIGHTQAAAGVAGVIKMVMAMRHGVLPQTLHVDEPSPHVDWTAGAVKLLTEPIAWPDTGRERRAAVSSFGISGTNAHVVLEEPPAETPAETPGGTPGATADAADTPAAVTGAPSASADASGAPAQGRGVPAAASGVQASASGADAPVRLPAVPWLLSGRSAQALRDQAGRLVLAEPEADPVDVAHSLVVTRSVFDHRAVVVGADRGELLSATAALAEGGVSGAVVTGVAAGDGKTVFVFPGQGSQWLGMGVELLDSSPVFAQRMTECETALAPFVDWSLTGVLRGEEGQPGFDRVDVVQPVLWAMMISLAAVWQSVGVKPAAVIGHSQGEIAAAVVAGALSLDDGARVVALRSQAIIALAGRGGMVSVPLPAAQVAEQLERWQGRISIAAINGPSSTVVSGDVDALEELLAANERAKRIEVDYASHSAHVTAIKDDLAGLLAPVTPRISHTPFFSTVTAAWIEGPELDAGYWYTNLRQTVQLEPSIRALMEQGHDAFVECSAHPVLTTAIQDTAEAAEHDVTAVGTLRRQEGGLRRVWTSAAEAWVRGLDVDWRQILAPARPRVVDLPTYAFQHQHFWLEERTATAGDVGAAGLGAAGHPLLGAAVPLAGAEGVLLTGRLSLRTHPWLAEHAVNGQAILPGTAFVDLALRAGDEVGCDLLDELTIQAPLTLPEQGAVQLQLTVGAPDGEGRRPLTVHARPDRGLADDPWTCHASGTLAAGAAHRPAQETAVWPPEGARPVDVTGMYGWLAQAGLGYGPTFQGLRAVWVKGADLYAEVALPDDTVTGGFGLHPALLDAALHSIALHEVGSQDGPQMPFAWSGVRLHATGAAAVRAQLSIQEAGRVTLTITDQAGAPVADVASLLLRPLPAGGGARNADTTRESLYELEWTAMQAGEPVPGLRWATVGDSAALDAAGITAVPYAGLAEVLSMEQAPDLVCVTLDGATAGGLAEAVHERTCEALGLLQEWLADERHPGSRLVLITRGAVAADVHDEVPDLVNAAVWGLARSAQSENPERLVLLDLDGHPDSYRALPSVLAGGENQVALREGVAYTPRLVRAGTGRGSAMVPPAGTANWRLDTTGRGTVDNLALLAAEDAPLDPGQVRIATRAMGLNFRDVLIALDMYPGEAPMGGEGAGVVIEVADDVTTLAPGDRVMGIVDGFARRAVTDHRLLARIPEGWSYTEAASVPIAFITAYHALVDLAQLRAGESLLVHAAAGGVGTAAVQLAHHLGAQVYGTAGESKWQAVRDLGVDPARIASSRTLDFARTFEAGVDVVLNSLAGEFIDASLGLLRPGGRFIEMGKTDLRDPEQMLPARYLSFDLTQLDMDRTGEILAEIVALFDQGALRLPPIRGWDVRRADDAFRHVAQARHIGKVVLTMPAEIDADGSVLVVGGTGALGALAARRLVTEHGVRHLVLAGRRGPGTEGAAELERELTELGASVRIVACDAADRAALARLLTQIPAEHPLTAVVSTAGVLDDGMITSLTPERLRTVLRPKVTAAINLHELTAELDLAQFVIYSGAAGVFGSPGQGNYAAANAFLDALAQHRSARGQAATSLAWGLWTPRSGSGMTGHLDEADISRLNRSGMGALDLDDGLALLDLAIGAHQAALVPIRLDLATLRAGAAGGLGHPLLRSLVRTTARRVVVAEAAQGESLSDRLAALPEADRTPVLLELVQSHVAAVLGFARPDAVEPGRAFKEIGFDSLTAVELRNRLKAATGLRLPASLVFDYPNPAALARHLLEEIAPPAHSAGQQVLAEIDRMEAALAAAAADCATPEEITSRLEQLLFSWKERQSGTRPAEENVADRLAAATADEILTFIDNELGIA